MVTNLNQSRGAAIDSTGLKRRCTSSPIFAGKSRWFQSSTNRLSWRVIDVATMDSIWHELVPAERRNVNGASCGSFVSELIRSADLLHRSAYRWNGIRRLPSGWLHTALRPRPSWISNEGWPEHSTCRLYGAPRRTWTAVRCRLLAMQTYLQSTANISARPPCDPSRRRAYVSGCLNVMGELSMLRSARQPRGIEHTVEDNTPDSGHMQVCNPSPVTGLFQPRVTLGDHSSHRANDRHRSRIRFHRASITIQADRTGIVIVLRTFPRVRKGESVGVVVVCRLAR